MFDKFIVWPHECVDAAPRLPSEQPRPYSAINFTQEKSHFPCSESQNPSSPESRQSECAATGCLAERKRLSFSVSQVSVTVIILYGHGQGFVQPGFSGCKLLPLKIIHQG
eukprot:3366600-Amphidinium_carterae.1